MRPQVLMESIWMRSRDDRTAPTSGKLWGRASPSSRIRKRRAAALLTRSGSVMASYYHRVPGSRKRPGTDLVTGIRGRYGEGIAGGARPGHRSFGGVRRSLAEEESMMTARQSIVDTDIHSTLDPRRVEELLPEP